MEKPHTQVDWRPLVGRFGEPIPKLKRDEKVRLKALLKDPESRKFERGWLLRIALAAVVPVSVRGYAEDIAGRKYVSKKLPKSEVPSWAK